MPNPTLTRTFRQVREELATTLGDFVGGTASGGSSTTLTDTQELDRYPARYFIGAEISTLAGTGSGQSRTITDHTRSGGTVTLTVPSWTAVDNTTVYMICNIGGRGFNKAQYDAAINAAVMAAADQNFTDVANISLAVERGQTNGASSRIGLQRRYEYPMPAGFNYLWAVEYLMPAPVQVHGVGNMATWRSMGDATARTRLGQGFQVQQDAFIEFVAVYMLKVGSPTDNLSIVLETNSAGVPSGTALTNGTSDNVDGSTVSTNRPHYVVFRFTPPVLVEDGTTYHITLRRSDAVSATNYWRVGEDSGNNYSYGTLSTYDATSWTAVSGSDLVFSISATPERWIELAPANWHYRPESTDALFLRRLPVEGSPLRLRGGAAIARLSAETDNSPVRPDWVIAYAAEYLKRGYAGQARPDNHAVGSEAWLRQLGLLPMPSRPLPANSVRIW